MSASAHGQTPPRVLVVYFSGTGNTEFVVRTLSEQLVAGGLNLESWPLESLAPDALPGHDLLAVGYPVYGFRPPAHLLRFLRGLSAGEARPAAVLNTHAMLPGNANVHAAQRLIERDYRLVGHTGIRMPGSDRLAFAEHTSRTVRQALTRDYTHMPQLDSLCLAIRRALGPSEATGANAASRPHPGRFAAIGERALSGTLERLERRMRSSLFATDRCIGCAYCAAVCPVEAIRIDQGRPAFSPECILCLRCLHNCPQEAIQAGAKTMGAFRWRGPAGDYRPPRRSGMPNTDGRGT